MDRWREFADRLEALTATNSTATALCSLAAQCLEPAWASLTLCLGGAASPLAGTGEPARVLDEVQFVLGEGPSIAAAASSLPVLATDLSSGGHGSVPSTDRWPSFSRSASDAGVKAAFAFPLQVGLLTIAVLTVYRDRSGPLTDDEYVDCLTVAAVGAAAIVDEQQLEIPGRLAEVIREGVHERSRLQRAAGMVAEHDGTSIVDAMVRIRGHAYATDRTLGDVVRDICERRLVLPVKEEQ